MPPRRRLPSLLITTLLLVSSLNLSFIPVAQAAPRINRVQGPDPAPPIVSSGDVTYPFSATGVHYKAEFKGNSRATNSVRFSTGNYSFTMNIATSQMTWFRSDLGAIVSMQQPMNPGNTAARVEGNKITYAGAWRNTDLIYNAYGDELKETLVIRAVSQPSNPTNVDYLQYAANCYYTNSLTIYADGVGYLHPTNQRFTTQGEIHFNDASNKTVYWLPSPGIYDSSGTVNATTLGVYAVNANNGVLVINIRFPKAFLDTAVFPVYLDPIVKVQGNAKGTVEDADGVGSFTVTMGSTPTNGNLLILTFDGASDGATNAHVDTISQTNVVWTFVASPSDFTYQSTEIWKGVISASAGTVITINFHNGASATFCQADVCEWSGLDGTVDKIEHNDGAQSATGVSGTTAETTQANELVVAAIGGTASSTAPNGQSAATNGFTLLDGVTVQWNGGAAYNSLGYLYKIVNATGAQSTGVTFAVTSWWTGCIATFKATGVTDYPRAGTQSFTLTKAGTKLIDVGKGATKALTFTSSNARLMEFLKGAAQSLIISASAGRLIEMLRGAAQALTFTSSTGVGFDWSKAASQALTLAASAARGIEVLLGATLSVTFADAASRLAEFSRSITQAATFTLSGTRMYEATRTASGALVFTLNAGSLMEFLKAATQMITFIFNADRLVEFIRAVTQAISFAATGIRGIIYECLANLSLSMSLNASPLSEFLRGVAITLTATLNASPLMEYLKAAAQALTFTGNAAAIKEILRGVTQTITATLSATNLAEYLKAASLTVGFSLASTRVIILEVAQSIALTLSNEAARMLEAERAIVQSLTMALNASRLVEFSRAISQAIVTNFYVSRLIEVLYNVTLDITLALGGFSQQIVMVLASLGIGFTSSAGRLIEVIKDATQIIALALNANRLYEALRDAAQGLTLANAASTLSEFARVVTQGIIFTWDATRSVIVAAIEYTRNVAQALTLSVTSGRLIEVLKDAAQAISFAASAIGVKLSLFIGAASQTITLIVSGDPWMGAVGGLPYWLIIVGAAVVLFFSLMRRR